MSAQLRSFLDFLRSPLRLWRRGRHLPGRVQAALLVVAAACLVAAVTLWTVVRAAPTQEPPDPASLIPADPVPQPVELAPAPDPMALYDRIRQLRTQDKDYAGARTLAAQFLEAYPEHDVLRQLVHYEYAVALFLEQRMDEALPAFQAILTEYAGLELDSAAEECKLDDALFFVAELTRRAGDKAAAVQAYETLRAAYPASNRYARAMVWLATLCREQGDFEHSYELLRDVVANHAADPAAPEAQIHIGRTYQEHGDYAHAVPELVKVADLWLQDRLASEALHLATVALVEEEDKSWAPVDGAPQEGTVQNVQQVQALVERLIAEYPDSPHTPGTMLDVCNYHARQTWWNTVEGYEGNWRIKALADRMVAMYPQARETRAVRGYLARMQWESDPAGAVASVDAMTAEAAADKDDEHYVGSLFLKMNFLRGQRKLEEARAVAAEILAHDCSPVFRSEVELCAAMTYLDEHDHEGALSRLEKIANNEAYPDDVRAGALSGMGTIYTGLRRYDEAEAAIRRLTEQFSRTSEAHQWAGWEASLAQRRTLLPAGQVFAN